MGEVSLHAFQVYLKLFAEFPQWKSDNISPYFCGGNPAVLLLRCIIACQTLFSPSFQCENMAMGMPHFHCKIWQSFAFGALRCISRVLRLCMRRVSTCLHRDKPKPSKTCWYVSHTWGNQCHLVTWIKTITSQWSCTQYSMNMHLQ